MEKLEGGEKKNENIVLIGKKKKKTNKTDVFQFISEHIQVFAISKSRTF